MVQILKENVRKKIAEAAEIQFAAVGFKKATIGNIAKEANVATGNIYKYFPNKKVLFQSIITENFVNEFSQLTRNRIETFEHPEGIKPTASYSKGKAGELIHFWITNRLKVVILLDRAEGTEYEDFGKKYVDEMYTQTISQLNNIHPEMSLSPLLIYMLKNALTDSVKGLVSTLEHFETEDEILEAVAAGTAYTLGGIQALLEWNMKQEII